LFSAVKKSPKLRPANRRSSVSPQRKREAELPQSPNSKFKI
jgi:hypothetical protein